MTIERAKAENEILRECLKEMYACLNNRILGTGANPSEDLAFRDQCIHACEAARVALRVTTT